MIMELFKIIKKTFDLVRKEVAQALSDSKSHAKKLVDAETTRTDNALSNKLDKVEYIPTIDIDTREYIIVDDPDFIEWNIFRRIYTKGVVVKTGDTRFSFYPGESNEYRELNKRAFYKNETSKYRGKAEGSGGLLVVYNAQFLDDQTTLRSAFGTCANVKYISITPLSNPSLVTSCEHMFSNCSNLIYTDFTLPTGASNYSHVYASCSKLIHKINKIEWLNAETAQGAFSGNKMLEPSAGLDVNLPICTDSERMFDECSRLKYVSNFSAPKCLNAKHLFSRSGIEKIDRLAVDSATDLSYAFLNCRSLKEIKSIEHSSEISVRGYAMFKDCVSLEIAPPVPGIFNSMHDFVFSCINLVTMPLYYVWAGASLAYAFSYCEKLTNVGGFDGVKITFSLEYSPLLTRESCQNIFNHLGDADDSAFLTLHREAYARLTEEDIAIAVNKGWTVQSV